MVEKVYLVTGNPEKLESAEKAFTETGIELEQLDLDIPEIQASSSLDVAHHTVRKATESSDFPVIREDHSLYLDAIPGFPGPYISYFDSSIPAEKLLQMLEGEKRTGYFEIATVLGLPDGSIKEYELKVPIKISEEIRGSGRNWNKVLMLRDAENTFAETDSESRLHVWNENFRKIAQELSEN